jgi:YesN/AraC family two-component response regulator
MMNILVVDDEAPIRDWIAYCIERDPAQELHLVAKARNGNEGLELALRHHPDLVITDILMPGMDGLAMMKQILEVLPYTNFIILSNYAEFSYARTALAYGAKHYLLKSEMRAKDLMASIESLHQSMNALLEGKKTDMYANGFLDIYDLYHHQGDGTFAQSFMQRHGMTDAMPYCVVGLEETDLFAQRQVLDTFVSTMHPTLCLAALQNHTILVFLQEHTLKALEEATGNLTTVLLPTTGKSIAVSHSRTDLSDLFDALQETERMVLAGFFYPRQRLFTTAFFHPFPPIDRQQVWKTGTDIFDTLQQQNSKKSLVLLISWLGQFERVGIGDIQWAKEATLRMLFTIEERVMNTRQDRSFEPSKEPESFDSCKQRLLDALHTLDEALCETYSDRIHKALAYMHEHYAQPISLVEVADQVNLSPEYFSRLFKEKTGENFSVHLMMLRLQQAQKLLRETDDKIYEIANKVGYASSSYFTKSYKKYMGTNPEDVRKELENPR